MIIPLLLHVINILYHFFVLFANQYEKSCFKSYRVYIYNRKYEFPGKQVIHNYYGNYKIKYYRNMFNLLNSGIVI